jgi:hypothetical protein
MTMRCMVVRGIAEDLQNELNDFLSRSPVRVLHMAQSESSDHMSVTLIFEDLDSGYRARSGGGGKQQEGRG